MKAKRMFLLGLFVTAGILVSAAPLIAATQTPSHPAAIQILDGEPTPTPTPTPQGNMPEDCSGNGC